MNEKVVIEVTPAQRRAAQILVRRAAETGRPVRDAIVKIANARRVVASSATSDQR